jgi:hypothetical protein
MEDKTPSQQIDDIINNASGWRGQTLSMLREIINQADSDVTEEVKWKKPSRPEGVPVWSQAGNLCIADLLKNAVRLTFPKGALLQDPKRLFNTRLDSKTVRAIDFSEGSVIDTTGLKQLVVDAVALNASKVR